METSSLGPVHLLGRRMTDSFHRSLLAMAILLAAGMCRSQTTWQLSQAPVGGRFYCYDPSRDRTVLFGSQGTWEYDGLFWRTIAASGPSLGPPFSGAAYDRTRQTVIAYDGADTWQWDGISWVRAATWPPLYSFLHLVAHEGRGTVIAFGAAPGSTLNNLYEWNGTSWSLIPATNPPPSPWHPDGATYYLSAAYDSRRDKLVLFGSAFFHFGVQQFMNVQPDLWEWDTTNGWVHRTVTGGVMYQNALLFFDSQRGVITSLTTYPNPLHAAEWDGGSSWQPLVPVTPIARPSLWLGFSTAYDTVRGQASVTFTDLIGSIPYVFRTLNPARFEVLGPGCAGSAGEPTLRLTHNWTRAWLGRTLSVDLANLPQSAGLVAIGWSDRQTGAFALPLPLAQFGMPGCFARVSTDLVCLVTGAGGRATLTLPVPVHPSLVGVALYQQGVSIDPGFNAAGLTVSNSVRVTVGSL